MIKEYLENEYREDLKKVFDSEPRDNGYFIINRQCFFNDSECRQKNQTLFKAKILNAILPCREFFYFISLFLLLYRMK